MNVWLLGNGFDLAHSLPTKYENFIHTMEFLLKHENEISKFETVGDVLGNEELQAQDKLIKKSYILYSDIYNKRSMNDWRRALNCHVSLSGDKTYYKSNYWLRYFINSFNRDLGWIDFEKEISNVVDAFKAFFKDAEIMKDGKKVNFVALKLEQHHIIRSFDFFYKGNLFLEGIGVVHQDYLIEKPYGSRNFIINKEKIADELYLSLRGLSAMLGWYLYQFIEPINTIVDTSTLRKVNDADYIISFNYTKTIETLYKKNVCHVHGKDFRIVLGINSDKDDRFESVDTLFLNFKKYYQRVRYETDIEYLKTIDKIKKEKSDNCNEKILLTVIGHSLDITDEDILREMFNLADEIKLYYHEDSKVGDYIKNLVNLYGREGFDNLRKNKHLSFELLSYGIDAI